MLDCPAQLARNQSASTMLTISVAFDNNESEDDKHPKQQDETQPHGTMITLRPTSARCQPVCPIAVCLTAELKRCSERAGADEFKEAALA
jgi:hypothetical protein